MTFSRYMHAHVSGQECKLTPTQVTDTHHLDAKPGYKVQDMNTASCDDTSKLTFAECVDAKVSLDWNAGEVTNVTNASLPKDCFRTKADGYRFEHGESSYLWYFNNADSGKADPKSQPVCKGNALVDCAYVWSIDGSCMRCRV